VQEAPGGKGVPPGDGEEIRGLGTASAWRWKRFRQAVVAEFVIYGRLAPGGTCPPLGGLEAGSA